MLCSVIASINNLLLPVACLLYQSQVITARSDARCTLQANHSELQKQNSALSSTVTALNQEVESLKASLSTAEQQVSDFQQQLATHAETHQATLEALEKQAETLQVRHMSAVAVMGLTALKCAYVAYILVWPCSPCHTMRAVVAHLDLHADCHVKVYHTLIHYCVLLIHSRVLYPLCAQVAIDI